MKKTVVIHQPDFAPYIGFFHRLLHADLYVALDDVQFIRRGWQQRDKIKTQNGDEWLSLQIKKAPTNTDINKIELAMDKKSKQKLLFKIMSTYKKALYFKEIEQYVEDMILNEETKLFKYNIYIIKKLLEIFDIQIDIVLSSNLKYTGKKNEMNADILNNVDATHYLSGVGAKEYFDEKPFAQANIQVVWQNFKHPVYPQLYGEFIPYLSCLDLLFNCGIENSRKILRSI